MDQYEGLPRRLEQMTHADRVRKMLREFPDNGISKWSCAPPLFRLLWKLGLDLPPPHFAPFLSNFVLFGLLFGIVWGTVVYLLSRYFMQIPFPAVYSASVVAGLLFGALTSLWVKWQASKLDLPSWEEYGETE